MGRTAEIELFRSAVESADSMFSVMFVHGPGGIGKSALLDRLAETATRAGVRVVRVDIVACVADPTEYAGAAAALESSHPRGGDSEAGRTVLVVDGYEQGGALKARIRDELIAGLPDHSLAVVASRLPPEGGWNDPVWLERLRSVALRGLSRVEAIELLCRAGVSLGEAEGLSRRAYGHPLALGLLADLTHRGADGDTQEGLGVDLVSTLLTRLVDVVPDQLSRHALQVSALARVTTEPLLREALGVADASGLFDWLHGLSFVDATPEGLRPHDLARDVLDLDLRWRDPEGYRSVFRRVRSHVHRQLGSADPSRREQAMFDLKFIFRNLPGVLSPVDWGSWGQNRPQPATSADHSDILELVALHEGDEAVRAARSWLLSQPEGFIVLRGEDGRIRGFVGLIDLTAADADLIDADPPASAAWAHATADGRLRDGEIVTQTRFVIDAVAYQDPSPTLNLVPVVTLQRYVEMPRLAFDFLTLAEPDRWDAYFRVAGLPRLVGADTTVGRRTFGLFCHDFRSVPVGAMIDDWEDKVLSQDFDRPSAPPAAPAAPDRQEFAAEVRQALGDLHRPDLLGRSALLRTRLLIDRSAPHPPDASALCALLEEAAESLTDDPRDDRMWQAVRHTYLRPSGTQEAVAARLHLPFSTYRRHLSQGRDRITEWCWQRELHG